MDCCIYRIRNLLNNHSYIGSTNNFKRRKERHISELKNNHHHSKYLQNAWNKYGNENFVFEMLTNCQKELLITTEKWYLEKSGLNVTYNGTKVINGKFHFPNFEKTYKKFMEAASKRRIELKKLTMGRNLKILELIDSGRNYVEISKIIKISPPTVRNVAIKYNKMRTCHYPKKELNDKIEQLINKYSTRKVADILNISKSAVHYRCAKYNLYKKETLEKRFLDKKKNFGSGENHSCAKLSNLDVLNIRKKYLNGQSITEIAKEYSNTSRSNVTSIVFNKIWKHI